MPSITQRLRDLYDSYAPEASSSAFDPALRGWGLMPPDEYRKALIETIERDYVPRFAEYGIDARVALEQLSQAVPRIVDPAENQLK